MRRLAAADGDALPPATFLGPRQREKEGDGKEFMGRERGERGKRQDSRRVFALGLLVCGVTCVRSD